MGASCLAEESKKYWGKEGTKKEQTGGEKQHPRTFLSFFFFFAGSLLGCTEVGAWLGSMAHVLCAGVLPHPDPVPACRGAQFLCLVLTADGAKALCKQQAVWRDFGWASAGRSDPSCSCGGMQRVKKSIFSCFQVLPEFDPEVFLQEKVFCWWLNLSLLHLQLLW